MSFNLNVEENRILYEDILTPPDGYSLYYAVGTTYSLDIQALTSVVLSLGLSKSVDESAYKDPILLLKTIEEVKDKLLIFYDATQLHVPKDNMHTLLLFEKILCPVQMKKVKNYLPSFHPKLWLIIYENSKINDYIYRFVVLSKNITFDKSWDIAFYMDGKYDEEYENNKPLYNFFDKIKRYKKENNSNKQFTFDVLLKEITHINFESNNFGNFSFIPFIPNSKNDINKILQENEYDKILIISPFISDKIIKEFNNKSEECYLITRKETINKLNKDNYSNFKDIYIVKDNIYNGNSAISEDNIDYDIEQKQDIHAKIYLLKKGEKNYLYFGSANASESAFTNNYEFLLGLESNKKLFKNMFSSLNLENEKELCIFEKYEPNNELDNIKDENKELENYLKAIIICEKAAVIEENNKYSIKIKINIKELPERHKDIKAFIKPYFYNNYKEISNELIFKNIENICELSTFFNIKVEYNGVILERLITIDVENLPANREQYIIQNIIKNQEDLTRYISLLFKDSELNILSKEQSLYTKNTKKKDNKNKYELSPALYEVLLKYVANSPHKIIEFKRIIDSLKPEEFNINELKNLLKKFEECANEQ